MLEPLPHFRPLHLGLNGVKKGQKFRKAFGRERCGHDAVMKHDNLPKRHTDLKTGTDEKRISSLTSLMPTVYPETSLQAIHSPLSPIGRWDLMVLWDAPSTDRF